MRLDAHRSGSARVFVVLVAAAHVSAGCYYQMQGSPYWEPMKGSDKEERIDLGTAVENARTYEIPASQVGFDGEAVTFLVYVTETRSEFSVARTDLKKMERQMANYFNPLHTERNEDKAAAAMVLALLGGGSAISFAVADEGTWSSGGALDESERTGMYLLGTALGALFFLLAPAALLPKDKTAPTGKDRTLTVEGHVTRTLLDSKASRNPAARVRVRASSSTVRLAASPGESSARTDATTDENGRVTFSVAAPGRALGVSKDDACARAVQATDLKHLAGEPRAALLPAVKKATSPWSIHLYVETLDAGLDGGHVANARKETALDSWSVQSDVIRKMIDKWTAGVVARLNSEVAQVRVVLKDTMTRAPVTGTKVTIAPDSESPEEIVSRYATGPVAKRIVAGVREYEYGRKTFNAEESSFTFSARVPCKLSIRVEHPDYAPAELSAKLDAKHLQKTVFLAPPGRGGAQIADE